MAFARKINNDELWEFIKDFSKKYEGLTPGAGFLKTYFKVSLQCIHQKLAIFERKGYIKRLKKGKNYISYIVIINE